jgi:hypothetical protein
MTHMTGTKAEGSTTLGVCRGTICTGAPAMARAGVGLAAGGRDRAPFNASDPRLTMSSASCATSAKLSVTACRPSSKACSIWTEQHGCVNGDHVTCRCCLQLCFDSGP